MAARQAMGMRALGRRLALAVMGACAVAALGGSPANAVQIAEPPVLEPLSVSQPTNLKVGSPRSEVQRLTIQATGGTYRLQGTTKYCGNSFPETTSNIPYNATAAEVEAAITQNGNSYCFAGTNTLNEPEDMVDVTGPPGGPYTIAYHMAVPPWPEGQEFKEIGNQPQPVDFPLSENLTGGAKKAVVEEVTRGAGEPVIYLSVTDVGGPTTGQIRIEDRLPAGITATKIEAYDSFTSLIGSGGAPVTCSPRPQTESPIVCTFQHEMITGDTLVIGIHVSEGNPAGTYPSEITVGGGGARTVKLTSDITVSDTPAPYGPAPHSVIAAASTNQAGAHPSVTTAFTMTTDEVGHVTENEKDIRFDFPPGLVGNTVGIPKCTPRVILEQVLGGKTCPKAAMVGMATLYIALYEGPPLSFITPIYAIEPAPGEPVAFQFAALLLPVRLDTSVLSDGNYGIRVTAPSLSEGAETFSTWITLWGDPADHKGPAPGHFEILLGEEGEFGGPNLSEVRTPLLTNPQQCGTPMQALMSTDSWLHQGVFYSQEAPMMPLVGCELLKLESSFTMLPDTLEAAGPAGYRMDLHVPQDDDPSALEPSTIKRVKLTLPVGTVVSPGVAWGLKACSDAAFGLHSGQFAECPREAQVGTVQIKTPALLEELKGQVYLASPPCNPCTPQDAQDGKMVRLFVQAVSEGESHIIVKLEGRASINQQTGQITATFDENPPLPFDEFKLNLGGGPRAALGNPRRCGPATTTMDLESWSTPFVPNSTPSYTFEVNQACFGPQFNPSIVAGTTSIQSGEFSPFTLAFGRSDQDDFLAGLQQTLPPGLLGRIAGVTLCQEPQASEGTCPSNSLVGHVQALTGPGADPYLVSGGQVFLTGGYKGAPFGLSIVVPAVAGPYTLSGTTGHGTVVVRAAINVDKDDAHLVITADPLPTELDGIPLQIKSINVTIDRQDFTFNPTSCEKMSIHTTLSSLEGMVANGNTPFQVTNCVGLGFNPTFKASTNGKTSRAKGASLDTKLIYPLGRKLANVKNVKVELPKQLPSRLTTLQKACPDHVFAENPESCPAASRIGQARASTPILPAELLGWAYFVSHGGAAFPNLVVVLQDRQDGVRVDLVGETFISKAGITSTTFGTVPDVPISSFELYLPQGPNSALAANGKLCTSRLVMPTIFNGQNGAVLRQRTPIKVTGCPKAKSAAKARRARKARKARKARRARKARTSNHHRHGGHRGGK